MPSQKIKATLTDVPETMLWTLHNRANEVMRTDGYIVDPKCVEIYQAIDYNYEKSFGKAEPSHATRSVLFDTAIDAFLKQHADAVIINLGEGLETQRFRFQDNPHAKHSRWYSVDLSDAIAIRERFIQPDEKHYHIACSATDTSWFDQVPSDKPVFISAQGLFMYFKEAEVKQLISAMCAHFTQGQIMFDVIPSWLSKKTMAKKGWQKTKHYTTPCMPWGINRNEVQETLIGWSQHIEKVEEVSFAFPRGLWHWLVPVLEKIPRMKNAMPSIQKITFHKKQ